MVKEIPINPRIVEQLSKATVKTLVDGIVELVTNSDDSYKELEEKSNEGSGQITIYVNRKKGGVCEKLVVKDFAEGMTKEELENAIEFGGETSRFYLGKSVRGLFGRGLKETIIALGEGEIRSIKDGKFCKTKVWFDKKAKKPQYDDELLECIEDTSERNGTEICIKITNEKIRISEYENFKDQLSKHYALRDINSSKNRKITLRFDDVKRGKIHDCTIAFLYPQGNKRIEKEISLPRYSDKARVTIYESPAPLETPRNNPYGLAGILIKTKGAILDNRLFRFENDPAALYFFGEAICDGLEARLRGGETELIDINRGGLEWRHEYCQTLEREIEQILEPLIFEKRKSLEKKPEKEVKEPTKKMLRKLCSLLNDLAKKELEEIEEIPVEPEPDIKRLVLIPDRANIQKDKPRVFSIYAPLEIIRAEGNEARIKSDSLDVQLLTSIVKLERHPKYPEKIWYRYFKLIGKTENAEGTITATLGSEKAFARVRVAPPKKRKKGKPSGRKGGLFSDIKPDEGESPAQRTFYDKGTGTIKIFVKFPSIAKIIKSGLDGAETIEGRILLAELVGEAFCRELARRKIEINPPVPGSDVDAFLDEVNKIQRKALQQIQQIISEWKFKE